MSGYFSESYIIDKIYGGVKRIADTSSFFAETDVCGRSKSDTPASLTAISELYY